MFILADGVPDSIFVPLANLGISGLVVAWFMWRDRDERKDRMRAIVAQERGTQALMVVVLALKHMDGQASAIKDLARKLEVDAQDAIKDHENSDR